MNLFTLEQFGIWCGNIEIAVDDAFAAMVMEKATELVVDEAKAPDWELDPSTAPRGAVLIALRVARRTYLNPDQEIASSIGPLSARVLEEAAAGMQLTEQEKLDLAELAPDGDPNASSLFTIRTTRGTEELLPNIELPASSVSGAGGFIEYAVEGDTSAFDPITP
jgi:hypothetical protein